MIGPQRTHVIDPALQQRCDFHWKLLPHHHRHRLRESLLGVKGDQILECRAARSRQFPAPLQQHGPLIQGSPHPLLKPLVERKDRLVTLRQHQVRTRRA